MAFINHTKGEPSGTPKVFIAIPTYSGKLDNRLVHSLIESLAKFEKEKIAFEFFTMSYHCHVDDARNEITAKFLYSDCDSLIFIDADVSWEPDALVKLAKHDRDVVAGVYPKRVEHDLEFPVLVEPGQAIQADSDGLVEVNGAPTGFMKIKRNVLEKLNKANSNRTYLRDLPTAIIFERTYEDGHRFSGDYSFCRSWKKHGGKVFVDPEMKLTHLGEVQFSGTLGDFWKEKHGVNLEDKKNKFSKAVENLRAGSCSESDILALLDCWGNPFAASGDLLTACYYLAKEAKGSVLETGSGLTTLVMALANPNIHIHALEHEPIWGSRLKLFLDIYNIKNVTVHFGELKSYEGGKWYDTTTLPDEKWALALCDGPPRSISNRNILWESFGEKLDKAVVMMDDVDNEDAVQPMRNWAKELGRDVSVFGNSKRQFAISPAGGSQ